MSTRPRGRKTWLLAIMLVGLLFVGANQPAAKDQQSAEMWRRLRIFADVLDIVQKNYVDDVKSEDLIYGAIDGMLTKLDPHSSFMPPDEYKELQIETKGSFGGIGIEITMKDQMLTVVSPIEGTPADKAGLKAGDKIVKIDGTSTKDMTLLDAVKKMRGKKATQVVITIMREGFTKPRDFALMRDIIPIASVKHKTLEPGYGYVRITNFRDQTRSDLVAALKELEAGKTPLRGLVLDLRNDPGGLLDQAVGVADEFIDKGMLVYTDGRIKSQNMKFEATPKAKPQHQYPIVCLVNEGSASASEIVAGALQDHKRALVLGAQTFGKGSVQTVIPLEDGSALRLTTACYYTPSGRSIQAVGITPDVMVDKAQLAKGEPHPFVRERDLEGHIKNPNGADEGPSIQKINKEEPQEMPAPETKPDLKAPKEGAKDGKEGDEADLQLSSAVQLLKSWQIFSKVKF